MLDQKTTTAPFFPLRQSLRLRRPSPEISGRLKSGTARPISCFSRTGVADIEWDNCNAVGGRVDSRKTLVALSFLIFVLQLIQLPIDSPQREKFLMGARFAELAF